jgi:mono/diheme cytochrome c family protein
MDKLINNFRAHEGIWGVVAVTVLTAGSVLYVSGRSRGDQTARGATAINLEDARRNSTGGSRASIAAPAEVPLRVADKGNPAAGARRYLMTCSACHGTSGLGQPHMGANLRDSRFIREQNDEALAAFVKKGRAPGDPNAVLGLSMPPMGGNPTLDESQIRDIVAFLRTMQAGAGSTDAGLN